MTTTEIGRQRLAQQRLTHNQFQTPEEVVAWLGAVQAQDYPGALWSLGLRQGFKNNLIWRGSHCRE